MPERPDDLTGAIREQTTDGWVDALPGVEVGSFRRPNHVQRLKIVVEVIVGQVPVKVSNCVSLRSVGVREERSYRNGEARYDRRRQSAICHVASAGSEAAVVCSCSRATGITSWNRQRQAVEVR